MTRKRFVKIDGKIWDSRTPRNEYMQLQNSISRHVAVNAIALHAMKSHIENTYINLETIDKEDKKLSKLLNRNKTSTLMNKNSDKYKGIYRKSFGKKKDKRIIDKYNLNPDIHQFMIDLEPAEKYLLRMAVVSLMTAFEEFMICYTANIVQSKKEQNNSFVDTNDLAKKLSKGRNIKLFHLIEFSSTKKILLNTPPQENDAKCKKRTASTTVNAYTYLTFFREYRNTVAHDGAKFSEEFFTRNIDVINDITINHKVEKIYYDDNLNSSIEILQVMMGTLYFVAKELNEHLILYTNGERGYVPSEHIRPDSTFDSPPFYGEGY